MHFEYNIYYIFYNNKTKIFMYATLLNSSFVSIQKKRVEVIDNLKKI